MPRYYVNMNSQINGDHKVHMEDNCPNAVDHFNKKDLGYHIDCHTAVAEAKNYYIQVNGCYYCCNQCHTE